MFITKTIAQGTLRLSGIAGRASPGRRRGRYGFLRVMAVYLWVVLDLAACGTTSPPATSGGPVTIGVLSCFTGLPGLGQAMWQGAQVAQKAISDSEGILGRQLKLVHSDTKCDAAASVPALHQILAARNLVGIIGPETQEISADAPIITSAKIPDEFQGGST